VTEHGTGPTAGAREAVFDLAVNRAAAYRRGLGPAAPLEVWQARTRFAARVDLGRVREALDTEPGEGQWHWSGGPSGGWHPGRARTP